MLRQKSHGYLKTISRQSHDNLTRVSLESQKYFRAVSHLSDKCLISVSKLSFKCSLVFLSDSHEKKKRKKTMQNTYKSQGSFVNITCDPRVPVSLRWGPGDHAPSLLPRFLESFQLLLRDQRHRCLLVCRLQGEKS